ncbi:Spindle pole body component [Mycena kentingensis (nom. inval.)]|nr:Spindle pole body component [Mycena kentingensis (nom. inval.)]
MDFQVAQLPALPPSFFLPRLTDKPQNPILDSLNLHNSATAPPLTLPRELPSLTCDPHPQQTQSPRESVWVDALKPSVSRSEIHCWDSLRAEYTGNPSPSPFLSEQPSLVVAAARYHVHPRLHESGTELRYVSRQELLLNLKKTVLGLSSTLHTWDSASETFVAVAQKGARGILLLDDKDDVLSASFMTRFLRIGTLIRRHEILVATLREKLSRGGPTIHAFTHALSTTLTWLRDTLAMCPPRPGNIDPPGLVAMWNEYEPYEDVLLALALLCGRAEHTLPADYLLPDHDPTNLLSLLHEHLQTHFERQSSKLVTAILAYILTNASRAYFDKLSQSVGFSEHKRAVRNPTRHDPYALDEDKEEEDAVDLDESLDAQAFPTFFPRALVELLPAAQKSLILLRAAEPEHPLLRASTEDVEPLGWFWRWEEIDAAWSGNRPAKRQVVPSPAMSASRDPQDLLSQFKIFDLQPGIRETTSSPPRPSTLHDFIDSFPGGLPAITPSFAHLTALILEPLATHAATLSRALLALFVAPDANLTQSRQHLLQFNSHLRLLQSYLLLASPSFKSRLSAALFSDLEGFDAGEIVPSSLRALRGKEAKFTAQRREAGDAAVRDGQQWAVGLSFALLERGSWPPVGADLSFFLRTVIVDSFEGRLLESEGGKDVFWVEAEKRLGFAIRDLPTVKGHDQWLNPLSIEALDFLYIDYKPPQPLDILILPDILSKYQRMFTYLLRIMRVQNALGAVFRMTRSAQRPLFPTLSQTNKLLLTFRFIAHSFVQNLSSYVLDTAIKGNFDPFLELVTPPPESSPFVSAFTDVFAPAKAHSSLLDDILAACLLRSNQRVAGDLLRQALELVLEFAVVVGERWEGRLEEYQAAPVLEELMGRFRRRMCALVKALKVLVEQGTESEQKEFRRDGRQPTGGIRAVGHLVEKLSEWWAPERSV